MITMFKRKSLWLLIFIALISMVLSSCGFSPGVGPAAQSVQVSRYDFIKSQYSPVEAADCTQVVEYIKTINRYMPKELSLVDYELSYDPELATVYATTENYTIAFLLDPTTGFVRFCSCTGTIDVKSAFAKALAIAFEPNMPQEADAIRDAVEEARWMNEINSAYIESQAKEYIFAEEKEEVELPDGSTVEKDTYDGFDTVAEAVEKQGEDTTELFENLRIS